MPRFKNSTLSSGFTSLSPRIKIRQLDSATGSYPSIARTGDKDRMGNYSVRFNDELIQIFGLKIEDSFSDSGLLSSTYLNPKKWTSSPQLEIREEILQGPKGEKNIERLLVFANAGDSDGRWIQTLNKVRNPIVTFDLVLGPHNQIPDGLNLSEASDSDLFKVQASTTGTAGSFLDVETFSPTSHSSFYPDYDLPVDDCSPLKKSHSYKKRSAARFRRRVKIHFSKFNFGSDEFYIRLSQPSISNAKKSVWAIQNLKIISMNQQVRYPILIDHDSTSGRKVAADFIATPHTRSDLVATGRTVSGISDTMIQFTPGEDISPFDDSDSIELAQKEFYNLGLNPEIYPGFVNPTRDKTKIKISLSQGDTVTSFGFNNRTTTQDPSNETSLTPQDTMVCWDNQQKNWVSYVQLNTIDANSTNESGILNFITQSQGLGFGPVATVATASVNNGDIVAQFGQDILSNYCRPVKTFGFPFDQAFERSSDSCVKMSDHIVDPFLLEKVVVSFNAIFEFASAGTNSNADNLGSLTYSTNNTVSGYPSRRRDDGHKVFIPTFFILNQKTGQVFTTQSIFVDNVTEKAFAGDTSAKDRESKVVSEYVSAGDSTIQATALASTIGTSISSTPAIVSEVSHESLRTERELVTYGQMTLFASASSNSKLKIESALRDGLSRDNVYNIIDLNGQGSYDGQARLNPITSSFMLEFPCRISPRTNPNQRIQVRQTNVTGDPFRIIYLNDQFGGRSDEVFASMSRALVNGNPGFFPGPAYIAPGPDRTDLPSAMQTVVSEKIDQVSPYVLMPGDNLIFGWQYPVPEEGVPKLPGSTDTYRNLMKLTGETKIYLYGSLLKENKQEHYGLNQNLSSDAVHEIVGAEKILDQFQVGTYHEYSGSFIDHVNYVTRYDVPLAATNFNNDRLKRIDITNDDTGGAFDGTTATSAGSVSDRTRFNVDSTLIGKFSSLLRAFNIAGEKIYADSNKVEGDFLEGSTYGTMQTVGDFYEMSISAINGSVDQNVTTQNRKLRQKFYFNHKHYGHSFDLFQQGKDSRFGIGFPSSISIPSPVEVTFVSGSSSTNSLSFEKFIRINSSAANISSNISSHATSSLPYFDELSYN